MLRPDVTRNTRRAGGDRSPTITAVFPDGRYDAIFVDADEGDDGAVVLELAIAAGEHRGEVVTITATGLGRDPLDLLAVPATLTVTDGAPTVTLEG